MSSIRYVATPRDLDELCELMATAHQRGLVVLPRGSGSKLSWLDLPASVDVVLDLSAFNGFRYDEPTRRAAMGSALPVAVAQDELARLGRRLPLDPPSSSATLGGLHVSGETGPLSHRFGPPAAHVIDATVVLPDGTPTRLAERIQLLGNAVCDLRWAYPGAPFPASAVADLTLKTERLPAMLRWVTYPVGQPMHVGDLLDLITDAGVEPAAIELDLPGIRMGAVIPGQGRATGALAVLIEGSAPSATDRSGILAARLGVRARVADEAPSWWGRYPFRAGEVALRLVVPDGQLHVVCYALADAAGAPIPVRGSLGAGPAWAALPGDLDPRRLIAILDAVREVLLARGGSAFVQAMPSELKEVLTSYRRP